MIRLACIALLCASTASADILVRFDEGAPKDRFSFTNEGACPLPAMELTLDLSTAPAGLIFDVTGSGAGVQVYQPFEIIAGGDLLVGTPTVADGDAAIGLPLRSLATGQTVAFTIDVDDTGGASETIVSGSEISGARVRASFGGAVSEAAFGPDAQARIAIAACLS
ncbi:MAG: aggregation factor core [Sulfitobacter sp.]|nr:aggregation factor core [Sulfitobacter sp.]